MNGADDMNSEQERVSAYLGGAMTLEDSAAFEREIAGDPELAAIVDRWRGNDELLRRAFEKPATDGVSDVLLGRLGLMGAGTDNKVIALDGIRERSASSNDNAVSTKWRWPLVGSIAASLIVAVAVGSYWSLQPKGIAGHEAFQTAMNRSASGATVALNDAETLTPILSFEANDGRFCREFAVKGHAAGNQGIACKSGSQWKVEALVNGGASLPSNSEIRTAGGVDGAALDAEYNRLGAGDPIDKSKETLLISEGWKKN